MRYFEEHGMSEIQIVKVDEGGVNARILAKEAKADFRRVEAASLKMPTRFTSAEGKRFFARLFNTLQLNTHIISVIPRTRLDHEDVAKIEDTIRAQMDTVSENLNKAIDGAEVLFKAHAITSTATYDTVPLDVEVHVLSSSGRRFLEVLGKLDQLMPLLQTLEIHEVITTQAVDIQRASLKRQVRDIANGARNFAMGLRRRMNAMGARDGGGRSADGRQEAVVVEGADEPRVEGGGEVEPAAMNSDTRLSESEESDHPSVGD
jgi:acetolactate synthase small subunit